MKTLLLLLLFSLACFGDVEPLDNFIFYSESPGSLIDSTVDGKKYDGGSLSIDSAGVFHLRTFLPHSANDRYLFLGPSPYGVKITVNGITVFHWGDGIETPCLANYRAETILLPADHLEEDTNTLDIEFISDGARIAFPDIFVGTYDEISRKAFWISFLNSNMIQIIVGIAFFSFAFTILFWILVKYEDETLLFLALFCLALVSSYGMFLLNNYHFDQVLLFKFARIGGVMMSLTMFLFVTSSTDLLNKYTYRLIVAAAFVPYIMLILNGTSKYQINTVFTAASHTLIFPLLIVGLILMIISMVRSFRTEVLAIFIPYLILMGAVFSDLGYIIQFRQPPFWTIPYGYLAMVAGGMFAILYRRTRQSGQYKAVAKQLSKELSLLESGSERDGQVVRGFLSEFSSISHLAEVSFAKLSDELDTAENHEELDYLYATFVSFHITSHNMIYLDKIKQGELYLWYDGFSLKKMFERRMNCLIWIAEEKGVELQINARKRSFPSLVWGDQAAVFQLISNAILCAVEIEKELLCIDVRYIPYEGLETVIVGNEESFSQKLLELCSTGIFHGETFPIAIVFKELATRLDTSVSQNEGEDGIRSVTFTVPLKLSEN